MRDEAAALAREVLARGGSLSSVGLLDPELPEDVAVEVAIALGRNGLRAALDTLGDASPPRIAGAFAGAGETLVEMGIAYARDRVVFGKPLAKFPVQRNVFATVAAEVAAALALARRAVAGDPLDVVSCVPFAADAAWAAAEAALQVHGGYGYTEEYAVSRCWLEVASARSQLG